MNRGCFVVFVSLIGLGALSYYVDRAFVVAAIALILLWLLICRFQSVRESKRLDDAFHTAFATFPGSKPELKRSSSYGYPFFSICFSTKSEMEGAYASGHITAFKTALAELYAYGGFDIERGFDATYIGWEADLRESMKLDPSGNAWIAEKNRRAEQAAGGNGGQAR